MIYSAPTFILIIIYNQQQLLNAINNDTIFGREVKVLNALLRESFNYIGVHELRRIPVCVLVKLLAIHTQRARIHLHELESMQREQYSYDKSRLPPKRYGALNLTTEQVKEIVSTSSYAKDVSVTNNSNTQQFGQSELAKCELVSAFSKTFKKSMSLTD